MKYTLTVSELKKTYKNGKDIVEALNGISFKVKKGEIFGLLGPNGAGKTTTINILTGILSPDSGKIKFFGKSPCEETQNRINAATAFNTLHGRLTVYQNLKVYAKMYNVQSSEERITDLLKTFYASDLKNKRVEDLSSGQKTRVNLCKSFINSPDLLFLDEATVGLDPYVAHMVRKYIKEVDSTIIYTSHIMSEVEQLCNRIAFLNKGKIMKIGTPNQIKRLIKRNVFIIEFLFQPKNAIKILNTLNIIYKSKNKIGIELKRARDIQDVIHKLITKGFRIRDLHIRRPSLDEVFIKIAKGEL